MRWLETDQKVAWHLQCGQAHAAALHPEDTVGTSEATRLDVPDGGLWLRADAAGKSRLKHQLFSKPSPSSQSGSVLQSEKRHPQQEKHYNKKPAHATKSSPRCIAREGPHINEDPAQPK